MQDVDVFGVTIINPVANGPIHSKHRGKNLIIII